MVKVKVHSNKIDNKCPLVADTTALAIEEKVPTIASHHLAFPPDHLLEDLAGTIQNIEDLASTLQEELTALQSIATSLRLSQLKN